MIVDIVPVSRDFGWKVVEMARRDPTEADGAERRDKKILYASVTITLAAVSLAIVHLFVPGFNVDAITIALLVLAAAPWLAPLFKTIELPGGWKFEFREFKKEIQRELRKGVEQVRDVAERVEEVAQFAISGAVPESLKTRLNRELSQYRDYLIGLGAKLRGDPPTVEIPADDYDNAHYDSVKNQIVVGRHFAPSSDVLFREYSHHVLEKLRGHVGLSGPSQDAVESGLADYFPCSFRDDPGLGRGVAAYLRARGVIDKAAIRNLENKLRLSDVPSPVILQNAGEVWGGAFWDVRHLLGAEAADRLLLLAWQAAPAGDDAERLFVRKICDLAGDQELAVTAVFRRRLLPV